VVLMSDTFSPLGLVIAGLVGLAVGIEREWSGHASGPGARSRRRTFFLLGLIGGLAGALIGAGSVHTTSFCSWRERWPSRRM
jgi:hypothetical protein